MSYHCGITPSLAAMTGREPCEPHIKCDDCGRVRSVWQGIRYWEPAKWFMNGKAAPGWSGGRNPDHTRTDHCPDCRRRLKPGPMLGERGK